MKRKEIIAHISKRRRQCLVHRYLYYVKAQPLVSDEFYDRLERELKDLVATHPVEEHKAEFSELHCPTRTVGSSDPDDYPRHIEQLAEDLLAYAQRRKSVQESQTEDGCLQDHPAVSTL